MFEKDLGIHIVETNDGKWIIGKILFDELTSNIKIKNPLGIESNSISSTEKRETFKLSLYTISELSNGEYIILPYSGWRNIFVPKRDLLSEYLRIHMS